MECVYTHVWLILISTKCLDRVNNCNFFSEMHNRESHSAANCECTFLMNTLSVHSRKMARRSAAKFNLTLMWGFRVNRVLT